MKTLYLQRLYTVKTKGKKTESEYGQRDESKVEEVLQEVTKMKQEVNS